jgi:hypothetical protein
MLLRRSTWTRIAVLLAIVAAVLVADGDRATAIRIPETLADQKPVQAGRVAPGFPIDYLGVVWEVGPDTHHDDHASAEPHGAVRFLRDGAWGPWIPLVPDGADAPGQWGSALVAGDDAEAYQVRGIPEHARAARVAALNTTDGPTAAVVETPALSALSNCLSRADWGADESWRFVDGVEDWPVTFSPVQAMTIHHTVTSNADPNPAATVRAIYHYHAHDRGWGDIAYQYLVDEAGRIYEGRWSGAESTSCLTAGGDGSDFGHDSDPLSATFGELVTGGHSAYYNQGNLGIALLGDFTNVLPTEAAVTALEHALAENGTRHGLDPLGMVHYVNPAWPDSITDIEVIAAHRDWPSPAGDTACPGDRLYPRVPDIRAGVALLMGMEPPTVTVSSVAYSTTGGRSNDKDLRVSIRLSEPLADVVVTATVSGPSSMTDTVTTDTQGVATLRIRNHRTGCYTTTISSIDAPGFVWDGVTPPNEYGCDPNPTTTTTTTAATTTTTTAPSGTVVVTSFTPAELLGSGTHSVTITGSGFEAGAIVSFSGGSGPAPEAQTPTVTAESITVDVVVKDGGPPRGRTWDVTVTNPDGSAATLQAAFTIIP